MTPLRDDMLRLLKFCPWTAYELADELQVTQQTVSRALNLLVAAGEVRIEGRAIHRTNRIRPRRSRVLSYGLAA
jgi:predicted ArsR family transcriptional regulator